MKIIKLEVLSKIVDTKLPEEDNQSYKNVLEDLGITSDGEDEEDSSFRPVYLNTKILNDELLSVFGRLEHPNHSILEYFDGRTMIINMPPDELVALLDDTQ